MFPVKNQNNVFVTLQIFITTFCTFVVRVNTEKKCEFLRADLINGGEEEEEDDYEEEECSV